MLLLVLLIWTILQAQYKKPHFIQHIIHLQSFYTVQTPPSTKQIIIILVLIWTILQAQYQKPHLIQHVIHFTLYKPHQVQKKKKKKKKF